MSIRSMRSPDIFDHNVECEESWSALILQIGIVTAGTTEKIGVDEMIIVNWEKGNTKPNETKFQRLSALLGNSMSSDRNQIR